MSRSGPTVDDSTRDPSTESRARVIVNELQRFGIEPVLKHFPFLPSDDIFPLRPRTARPPSGRGGALFSLSRPAPIDHPHDDHLNDSLVDSRIVTFSPAWVGLLRKETGFAGLLMSDGLLMLRNYADRSVLGGIPPRSPEAVDLAALGRPPPGLCAQSWPATTS